MTSLEPWAKGLFWPPPEVGRPELEAILRRLRKVCLPPASDGQQVKVKVMGEKIFWMLRIHTLVHNYHRQGGGCCRKLWN